MKACDMQPNELESLTADQTWRTLFKKQVSVFEDNRVLHSLQDKRAQRKTGHQPPPDRGFTCDICSRVCASRIGLFSHRCTHTTLWSGDPSRRRLSPTAHMPLSLYSADHAFPCRLISLGYQESIPKEIFWVSVEQDVLYAIEQRSRINSSIFTL